MTPVRQRTTAIILGLLASMLATPELLTAQSVPVVQLGAAEHQYERDFANLRALRPLSDGRLIAVEGLAGEVVMLSPTGAESPVGSRGRGPSEYMTPSTVIPIGDSDFSLIVDPDQQRLLITAPTGQIIATEPWALPMLVSPGARDAMEGFYFDDLGEVRMDAQGTPTDGPRALMRVRPGTPIDTIATLHAWDMADRWNSSPISRMFNPGPDGVALMNLERSAFGAQDQWRMLPSGDIVIARARPYRIEIRPVAGAPIVGPEIGYEPVPVTRADRQAYLASQEQGSGGGSFGFSTDDGGRQELQRPGAAEEDIIFPDQKPPFPFGGLHASPTGDIYVQRSVPINADHSLIDVFDGQGRLVRQYRLAPGRILVGAGPGTIFTIRYNEFDVQLLERFRLPG